MKVFIDTGAICAAVIPGDAHNRTAKNMFLSLQESNAGLFTSDYVLAELYTLLRVRSSHRTAVAYMDSFENTGISMLFAHEIIGKEAKNIFRKYDLPRLSFTDCTSFALINTHRIDHVFSFDEHFRIFRFDHPVTLLGV